MELDKVRQTPRINSLENFPERGGYVPELLKQNIKDYRQLIESPWKIIYKIEKNLKLLKKIK